MATQSDGSQESRRGGRTAVNWGAIRKVWYEEYGSLRKTFGIKGGPWELGSKEQEKNDENPSALTRGVGEVREISC